MAVSMCESGCGVRSFVRKVTTLLLAAVFCTFAGVLLCACGQQSESNSTPSTGDVSGALLAQEEWGDYFSQQGEETLAWAQAFAIEDVESVHLSWYMVGGVVPHVYTDDETIVTVFNALAALSLDEPTNMVAEDNSIGIRFTMSDGSEMSFSFNNGNAEFSASQIYTLKNTDGLEEVFALARDIDTSSEDA